MYFSFPWSAAAFGLSSSDLGKNHATPQDLEMLYSSHGMIVRRMEKLVTSGLLSHSEGGTTSPRKDAGLSRCLAVCVLFLGTATQVPGRFAG